MGTSEKHVIFRIAANLRYGLDVNHNACVLYDSNELINIFFFNHGCNLGTIQNSNHFCQEFDRCIQLKSLSYGVMQKLSGFS